MSDERAGAPPRRYANWLEITFSDDEFVLDFGQRFDEEGPDIHSSVVTTPRLAREFADMLNRSLDAHRARASSGHSEPSR